MTIDVFLDDYVPRVLRPMGGWFVSPFGLIRYDGEREWSCPITATRDKDASRWKKERKRLGLSKSDAARLVDAADGRADEPELRRRLLQGLGLGLFA